MGLFDGAVNARVVADVQYDQDPVGVRLFGALASRVQRGITGTDGVAYRPAADHPEGGAFNGDFGHVVQPMRGVAALGTARTILPRSGEMADERASRTMNPFDDPALRIMAERMERRR